MHPFAYARPATLAEAVSLLEEHGPEARLLAGGTDLLIRLRDGSARPAVVVDVKRIAELRPAIREDQGRLVISAGTVMTDVAADDRVRRLFPALAEAAAVVGSVQIRNRATLAGNVCNASPAADTAPSLLVYDATVVAAGPGGTRRIPIDAFFVRSGVTTLARGELVTALELPTARPGRWAPCTCAARGAAGTIWRPSRSVAEWTRLVSPGSPTAASARGRSCASTRVACSPTRRRPTRRRRRSSSGSSRTPARPEFHAREP